MNRVELTACVTELSAMRYTPAGLPALDIRLEHESTLEEAGQSRQVKLALRAVALGALAERVARQTVGSTWVFQGFLATPRNSKTVIFHLQDIQSVS